MNQKTRCPCRPYKKTSNSTIKQHSYQYDYKGKKYLLPTLQIALKFTTKPYLNPYLIAGPQRGTQIVCRRNFK